MDQELIAYLDERFRETLQQIASLREEIRHTHVVVEGLRGDIQLVAEGFIGLDARFISFQEQMKQEFQEVRSSFRLPYSDLDRRLSVLERDPMVIIRERFGKTSS